MCVAVTLALLLFGVSPTASAPHVPLVTTRHAVAKRPEVDVPGALKDFFETMKGLSSHSSAPYAARVVPEKPKADLSKLINYIGPNGIEFINLTNEGITKEHPAITRRTTRDQLTKQIRARRGQQLLWLMELAHHLRWWTDQPSGISSPEKGTLVVTFTDDYVLTFREQGRQLQLVKVEYLRDPDGGD